jgi:predicted AlkP superfamily phosphohydrolase/phosphomutase
MNVDFLHLSIFYINTLQHFFGNEKYTRKGWKIIDQNIGYFIQKGYEIIIFSDHGSNLIKSVFYINNWLEKKNYLHLSFNLKLSKFLGKFGINLEEIERIAHSLRVKKFLKKIIPKKILEYVPYERGLMFPKSLRRINWDKTIAVGSPYGLIYINLNKKSLEYKKTRNKLIKELENLRSHLTGDKIAKKVYKREELYSEEYMDEAPDLIIDPKKGVHISAFFGSKNIFESPRKWKRDNKRKGLFIAYGKNFKRGMKIKNARIIDIAPTILHIFDIPIPNDMDGKILNIFKKKVRPSTIK